MNYRVPNTRMASIPLAGGIREILAKAESMEKEGRSIIHMEIGRPDFDSPACAKKAVIKAIESGDVHYTDMAGTYDLRLAVAEKFKRDAGLDIDPNKEVIITAGAMEALLISFLSILEPGDEVIIPTPFFAAYTDQLAISNAVVKPVPCSMENGFRLQVADLKAAITPKTRILLLNTPNNPAGASLTRSDLEGIAAIAIEHDLLVISDECYEKFAYDSEHVSMASLPNMRERTITVSAASKTFSMTGWRIGWTVMPEQLRRYALKCHQNVSTCANSFAQAGVAEALRHAWGDVDYMVGEYKKRRDLIFSRLSKIDGFEILRPDGAFYAFPRIKKLGMTSMELCTYLLEEAGVSTVPGQAFGMEDGYMRIAYCRPESEISEAMDRIAAAVAKLNR